MKNLIYVLIFLVFAGYVNAQWVQMSNGMGINKTVSSLAALGTNIFAGTDNSAGGIYLSTNNGTSWTQNGLTSEDVACLLVSGTNIFAGTDNHGVVLSTNNGVSWSQTSLSTQKVNSLASFGTNLFAGTLNNGGVYLSTNSGVTWMQTSLNNMNVYPVLTIGTNVLAGTGTGVYISTNTGTTWSQTALNNKAVIALNANGTNIFAGTYQNGVYLSTNNSTSWTQTSLNNRNVYSLASSGLNIFAGTDSFGVYVSNNNGTTWTQRNEGLNLSVYSFCILSNYIYAGTGNSVFRRLLTELIGIKQLSCIIPDKFSLSQNFPNPFNPTTNIKFDLPKKGLVTLNIFDALGREVATLVNEQLAPGTYETTFDASAHPSGIYFYKLTAGDFTDTKRMILLK